MRPMTHELILDNWAHFSFKPEYDQDRAPEGAWLGPMWVGKHRRRLSAYTMCKAYLSNSARWYLSATSADERDQRMERHEYGDPELIVSSILAALLGEDVRVGAPDDVDAPQDLLDWCDEWSGKVKAIRKLHGAERHAVGEGDGVLVVGWDDIAGRPSLMPYDPGFYFPVLTDFTEEYPRTVHLAWELDPDDYDGRRMVRRITYELVEVVPRALPWNTDPSGWTCLWSDGIWELGEEATVEDLTGSTAVWNTNASGQEIKQLDLDIDFIPVIHIPNTIADEEHFGVSSLATVLQLLDEISATDTDLSKGAAIAGFPPLATDGGALAVGHDGVVPSYGPGTVFNGRLTSVDTSAGLKVLMDYMMFLLKRLNTNVRVPEVLLGRVDPSNVPSGVAIELMFTQMKAMIGQMRLVREEKHPLVFKFAARFAMKAGRLPATTDWPNITFLPGQFVPTDLAGTVTWVIALFASKVISHETTLQLLLAAGVPIDDIDAEIRAVQKRDYAAAQQAALVDEALGHEVLGRTPAPRGRPEAPPDAVPGT